MKKLEILTVTGAVYFFMLAVFLGIFGAAANVKQLKASVYGDPGESVSNARASADALSATGSAKDSVPLPVLMYHSILNSVKGTYVVSEEQLDSDLKALKDAGYETVLPSEVIAYSKGIGSLPEKPVMISFDDGYYNNMYYGLPLFKRYGAKAVINVIGIYSDSDSGGENSNPNYSYLTWKQIGELSKSGYFEIGNHTYDMHRFKPRYGMARKYGETDDEYRAAIRGDLVKLQNLLDDCMGVRIDPENPDMVRKESFVRTIAFPYGRVTPIAKEQALDMGFELLLTCTEGVSVIERGNPKSLYNLKRINRSGYYTTEKVMKKIAA